MNESRQNIEIEKEEAKQSVLVLEPYVSPENNEAKRRPTSIVFRDVSFSVEVDK